eukprot:363455-Chlamydomonas_euryale.AAC.3
MHACVCACLLACGLCCAPASLSFSALLGRACTGGASDHALHLTHDARYAAQSKDMNTFFSECMSNRSTTSTKLNDRSSRSHAIFTITVHRTMIEVVSGGGGARVRTTEFMSKLHLVDLAGSERNKRSVWRSSGRYGGCREGVAVVGKVRGLSRRCGGRWEGAGAVAKVWRSSGRCEGRHEGAGANRKVRRLSGRCGGSKRNGRAGAIGKGRRRGLHGHLNWMVEPERPPAHQRLERIALLPPAPAPTCVCAKLQLWTV